MVLRRKSSKWLAVVVESAYPDELIPESIDESMYQATI